MTQLILIVIIALAAIGAVAALAHWVHVRKMQRLLEAGEIDEIPEEEVADVDAECCGQHQTCEKESLLAAVSRDVEYYDDEDLDRFRGRRSDEYAAEEVDEFRDVMYTMREEEVAGWVRSLQLRQIEVPEEMKEEIFLIVGELRSSGH